MAEKKKAYRRFEELTRRATASTAAEAGPDPGVTNQSREDPGAEVLSVRLAPEVRRALEQQAAAGGATPSEIVEAALRRYLELPG